MKRIIDSNRTPNKGTEPVGSAQRIRPFSAASSFSTTATTNTSGTDNNNTQRINLSSNIGIPSSPPPLYGLFLPPTNEDNSNSATMTSGGSLDGSSNLTVPSLLSISDTMNSTSLSQSSFSSSSARLNVSSASDSVQMSSRTVMSRGGASSPALSLSPPPPPLPSSSSLSEHQKQSVPTASGGSNLQISRSRSRDEARSLLSPPTSPVMKRGRGFQDHIEKEKKKLEELAAKKRDACKELGKSARKENDSMVYLDGPRIYTCGECRTHLTSHDEIISKSFHGRHGRAYLFDQCVNITHGVAEDRRLITGLHSVCDIFCKRCKTLIGWTYAKAYEPSQKYKEGKFIIEKIHLHMEESGYYDINLPAGEKRDRWKIRSMSWSSDNSFHASPRSRSSTIYEYSRSRTQSCTTTTTTTSPKSRSQSVSTEGMSSLGSPLLASLARAPSPPAL